MNASSPALSYSLTTGELRSSRRLVPLEPKSILATLLDLEPESLGRIRRRIWTESVPLIDHTVYRWTTGLPSSVKSADR